MAPELNRPLRRVAVTGATGFVGRELGRQLVAAGYETSGIVRRHDAVLPEGVTPVYAPDLTDTRHLQSILGDVDAVVHLAARVHVMRETEQDPISAFRRVNVDGTRSVARAALAAGARRFVYVSSIKVNGEGRDHPYTENDPPGVRDPYGQSKWEAEQAVAEILGDSMGWTILRPPLVYGPGVGGNFLRLLRLADLSRRIPLPLGGVHNRRSMIFVGNLAGAISAAIARSESGGAFPVSDGEDLSTTDLVRRLAAIMGDSARLLAVPPGLLRVGLALTGKRAEAMRLLGSLTIDQLAFRRTASWTPRYSMEHGLRQTVTWWKSSTRRAFPSVDK